jgi:two-component system sensor histidine kinase VicK
MNVVIYSHRIIFQLAERLFVYADREKISQVLQNLVGNAIKYSASGTEIRIRYAIDDGGNIAIAVEDQGMGIAKEDQRQIFERFYRVENPHTGSIAGFGIGLYLCREIVELHQGMLSVESKIGLGSTFIVKLPINSGSTVHHEVKG